MDGSVGQDLSIAGPSAVRSSVVTGRSAGARGSEAWRLVLARVARRGEVSDPRLEIKLPHAVDLHKRVVELRGGRVGWS